MFQFFSFLGQNPNLSLEGVDGLLFDSLHGEERIVDIDILTPREGRSAYN